MKRTYRYGGGYQGHNATLEDKSSHTNLKNPDPAVGDWEKTIVLEYPFESNRFEDGKYEVMTRYLMLMPLVKSILL